MGTGGGNVPIVIEVSDENETDNIQEVTQGEICE